jgi:tRNA-uridine 2-sulfurtransferase
MNKTKTVFVGLSGGVDSSVAALRLKKQGYNVVGVFIKVWHPDFLVCNWEEERLSAMRVAAHLEIPFLTCDAESAYRDDVAHYFISEYLAGRTPNPDVMCNKYVKFGAFIEFAKKQGADFIATGHYAQNNEIAGSSQLLRGVDNNKDQSYFLWTLTPEQLSYTLLPVGNSEKSVIRKEASEAKLPTATKKDSQGVCFLGHIDIKDFLSHYTELKTGAVLNENDEVIGEHDGALIYTVGQRHGFTINAKGGDRGAYYVVKKDIHKNTLTVSTNPPKLETNQNLTLTNHITRQEVKTGDILLAQTRYRQTPFQVKVLDINNTKITLTVEGGSDAAAKGQSCVLYRDSLCIGGGIIA